MPARDSRPVRVAGRPLAQVAARAGAAAPAGSGQLTVTGVVLDSRRARPGDLYAALPGAHTHGARFAAQAAQLGATALLTDPEGAQIVARLAAEQGATARLPAVVVDDPRAVLGAVSALVYGEPAQHLQVLGVTGTNGKTTVTTLLESALAQLGTPTALVGTVCTRIAGEELPSARTTPEAPDLHALLALAVERGARAAALEVSSHAVVLHRVDGLVLDVAAFTNLSQDHLDFHPTMDDYFAAKAQLFTPARARAAVVCVDDEWGRRLAELSRAAGVPTTTVMSRTTTDGRAAAGQPADWSVDWSVDAASVRERSDGRPGSAFTLIGPGGRRVEAASPLPGTFNIANTAVAVAVLAASGHDPAAAAAALAGARGVPGRMEVVLPRGAAAPSAEAAADLPAGLPVGVVDYAHTPDAVAAALAALRPSTPGRLVVVLGAGGDRDPGKRPAMGAAAAAGADAVVVTDDNPRSEDPAAIRAAVLAGATAAGMTPAGIDVVEVPDRREAVARGVALALAGGPGGTVLVAGKGHERGQEVAGAVHPFDDREELAAALAAATEVRA
ncbi:UDP-N-acetylmuramoyl-L-alanyl-D-glutamate--2,6-diaminopimelate ligase [Quadrisphaera granulorum]|uniref:UDP-N-acetylmuramoyl-L-alanyl-D-glutamate--2, 6-diaminopimelate ligase n=1 Tax=Quadrisphaera granulorum TaxID=317664 RepID=UPI001FE93DF0|nr:UDP-N-acetylmuramoyl-L-alanyl-D-glutamate--2,6-diaminopimelate ligase [Quadrisphaera granulorum]